AKLPVPKAGDAARLSPAALRKTHEQTEALILTKEEEKAALEARLADPALYADATAFRAATEAYETIQRELAALYTAWEQTAEALATAGG
ncbi:MAG TPA: ABC transporter C-terminal domain-containing protein, partial [Rhodothermales bacterium]|nr:ABC transporter C-terminal domain-containing protein [Rhodothermales bacterium]